MLPKAEKVPRAPQLQVLFRNSEAVAGFRHDLQALPVLLPPVIRNQDTVALPASPADTPPKLMQLGKPKPFRILDQHDVGVRHIHTDLHHRRRDQDPDFPGLKSRHQPIFLFRLQPPVEDGHGILSQRSALKLFQIGCR